MSSTTSIPIEQNEVKNDSVLWSVNKKQHLFRLLAFRSWKYPAWPHTCDDWTWVTGTHSVIQLTRLGLSKSSGIDWGNTPEIHKAGVSTKTVAKTKTAFCVPRTFFELSLYKKYFVCIFLHCFMESNFPLPSRWKFSAAAVKFPLICQMTSALPLSPSLEARHFYGSWIVQATLHVKQKFLKMLSKFPLPYLLSNLTRCAVPSCFFCFFLFWN